MNTPNQKFVPQRVCVYIDGFNVYHHIRQFSWKKHYWLDYTKLTNRYKWPTDKVVGINYFTALFYKDKKGEARHKAYISVLNTKWVKTILGKYQEVDRKFHKHSHHIVGVLWKWFIKRLPNIVKKYCIPYQIHYKNYEEKRTDVNIATRWVKWCIW